MLSKAISCYCCECVVVAIHAVNVLRKPRAINPRSRLRWSCDRDPVECTLHFYFALCAAAASAAFAVVLHTRRGAARSASKAFQVGSIRLQGTEAAFPRHCMKQNSHSMRRASVTQRWLDIQSHSVVSCSCTWLVSQLFATRLRWSHDRDQAECNLQKHFAARATATPALTSYAARLKVACVQGAAQMYLLRSSRRVRGALALATATATLRCQLRSQLRPHHHAIGLSKGAPPPNALGAVLQCISCGCAAVCRGRPSATRLRWSGHRDPVECTIHFYFALEAATAAALCGRRARDHARDREPHHRVAHPWVYVAICSCTCWAAVKANALAVLMRS